MKFVVTLLIAVLLCHEVCDAKNRIKKHKNDANPGWGEHEIGALHANAHHGADHVAKSLKKPQKEVDQKMKDLGYHQHVPKRPRSSAARKILDKMREL
jgi:hypothetical protein